MAQTSPHKNKALNFYLIDDVSELTASQGYKIRNICKIYCNL